jgi:hypothetical protein
LLLKKKILVNSDSSEKDSNSKKSIVEPTETKSLVRPKQKTEIRNTEKNRNPEKRKKVEEEKEDKFLDTKSFHSEIENNQEIIEHWNQANVFIIQIILYVLNF